MCVQEPGEVVLPTQVHRVFIEVLQYVARCKLAVLAAIKHAFCGILTLEIAKVLAPAAPAKQASTLLSALSLTRTVSDKRAVVSGTQPAQDSVPNGTASRSSLAAIPEGMKPPGTPDKGLGETLSMGQNPTGVCAGVGTQQMEGLSESAALKGLLEIIDREFQVSAPFFTDPLFHW